MLKIRFFLAVIIITALLTAPTASAMEHDAQYTWEGDATMERQVGSENTGAQQKVKIEGEGQMERESSVSMTEGKMTVDKDSSVFETSPDASRNLTVTSVIELCAPGKHQYSTTEYVYDPGETETIKDRVTEERPRMTEIPTDPDKQDLDKIDLTDPFLVEIHVKDEDGEPFTGTITEKEMEEAGEHFVVTHATGKGTTASQGGWPKKDLIFDESGVASWSVGRDYDEDDSVDLEPFFGFIDGDVTVDSFVKINVRPEVVNEKLELTKIKVQEGFTEKEKVTEEEVITREGAGWQTRIVDEGHVSPDEGYDAKWENFWHLTSNPETEGMYGSLAELLAEETNFSYQELVGLSQSEMLERAAGKIDSFYFTEVEELTDQTWAAQVEAEPGEKGRLDQSFEAAYGDTYAGQVEEKDDLADDEWGFTEDKNVAAGHAPVRGEDYVGNYFHIDQFASTSEGTVKRYIDISSPFTGSYLHEDFEVVGEAQVEESFSMENITPGEDADILWHDLF